MRGVQGDSEGFGDVCQMLSSLLLKGAPLRSGFLSYSLHHLEHLQLRYKIQIGIVKRQ